MLRNQRHETNVTKQTSQYKRHNTVGHVRHEMNVTKRMSPNEGHETNVTNEYRDTNETIKRRYLDASMDGCVENDAAKM